MRVKAGSRKDWKNIWENFTKKMKKDKQPVLRDFKKSPQIFKECLFVQKRILKNFTLGLSINEMKLSKIILLLFLFSPLVCVGEAADLNVCFTPGERCDLRLIEAIGNAKRTIEVQAYQLTSKPIQNALVKAFQRGVKVEVILDKSQLRGRGYPPAIYFHNMHVPTWIDNKPAIAHNKVMIIDSKEVITVSYNYSRAAQYRNAENMVIIISPEIASQYQRNFDYRLSQSEKVV